MGYKQDQSAGGEGESIVAEASASGGADLNNSYANKAQRYANPLVAMTQSGESHSMGDDIGELLEKSFGSQDPEEEWDSRRQMLEVLYDGEKKKLPWNARNLETNDVQLGEPRDPSLEDTIGSYSSEYGMRAGYEAEEFQPDLPQEAYQTDSTDAKLSREKAEERKPYWDRVIDEMVDSDLPYTSSETVSYTSPLTTYQEKESN